MGVFVSSEFGIDTIDVQGGLRECEEGPFRSRAACNLLGLEAGGDS